MKKLIKIILCIAAGCIGMGCAFLVIGIVLGRNSVSSGHGWLENTIWNITDGVRKGVDSWVNDRDDDDDWDDEDDDREHAEYTVNSAEGVKQQDGENVLQVDADQVQRLDIDMRHGYLEVERSEDDQIYVSWSSKKADYVQAACESGKLVVRDTRQGSSARKDIEIYVSIPAKKQFDNVELKMDAGELEIDTPLSAGHMQLNADAGVITAEGLASDDLEASVGAGEIELSESSFGKAALNCGVGTIDLEGDIRSDARAECGMGTIDLDLEQDTGDYNYVLNCGMGSIDIGDESYSALAREKWIDNGAGVTFTLNCGMGEITID